MSGWGFNQPTQKLVDAFDAVGDTIRKKASIRTQEFFQYMCDTAGVATQWQGAVTGYWDAKHSLRVPFYLSQTQVNQNIIVLRYADVLLMLAEAHNRNGNDVLARTYLNEVRTRAGLPDVSAGGADLFEAIKKERQLELNLEGDRYFDLVRWGDAEKELGTELYDLGGLTYITGRPGVSTNGLLPIPQPEIDALGDPSFQNPGY